MDYMYLLDEVIERRLEIAADEPVSEESKRVFKEAMEAIDRKIQLERIEVSRKEVESKELLEREKLSRTKEEQKKNDIMRIVEVVAVPVGLFMLDCLFKRYYMRSVCNFEKDYTFTTTPGKSISGLFKFKK